MTQSLLDLQPFDNIELINETVEAIKQKLDHVSTDENTIWSTVHNHLKFDVSEKLTISEYDKITLKIESHIKENIL